MQLRSRLLFGLVVTMLVLAMAPTSNAQINIQLFPNGAATEINTNRTAATADITSVGAGLVVSGSLLASSPLTSTTLTITYPGPISSSNVFAGGPGAIPAADPLRVIGATGVFASASIITVGFSAGTIQLGLPGFANVPNPLSGSFRVVGVRLDATGLTAPATITAALSNSANNYLLSTTSATVINTLSDGIASMAVGVTSGTSLGTATLFSNGTVGDATASVVITEGFASAWRTSTQSSGSGTALGNGVQVELTFTGIPSGVTLTLATLASSSTLTVSAPSDTSLTSASADNDATFSITGSSLTATESFGVSITAAGPGIGTAVTTGSITVNANLNPLANPLSTGLPVETAGSYPAFSTKATAEVTVATIVATVTNLLVPFVTYDGLAGGFDTGIAVANTTADPFAATAGGATAGSGTISVFFYPRTATGAGTSFTLTTGTGVTPGVGLSATGTLASGGTWSVLLSELLTAANQSGAFTGYVFVQPQFILAHGTSFVTNFSTFTSASPMLIVPQTEVAARTGGTGGGESLGL